MTTDIRALIAKGDIALSTRYDLDTGRYLPTGKLAIRRNDRITDEERQAIIDAKPEILALLTAELDAKEQARLDRLAKIDAIEGLRELEAAIGEAEHYRELFDASFEGEYAIGGMVSVPMPDPKAIPRLMERYPRAAAYLKARAWSESYNLDKSGAGQTALERIIDGDDYKAAIADMDQAFSRAVEEHIWD